MEEKIKASLERFQSVADNYGKYQDLIAEEDLIYLKDFAEKFQKTIEGMQK